MNGGIEMLMARMDTHPEEFIEGFKWGKLIQDLHKYAEADESKALNDKLKKVMMQHLTEQIMEELVDPKSQTPSDIELKSAMLSGGQTHAQHMAIQQAWLAQQQAAQAQQATNAYNNLGSAGQGLLSSLFGGNK